MDVSTYFKTRSSFPNLLICHGLSSKKTNKTLLKSFKLKSKLINTKMKCTDTDYIAFIYKPALPFGIFAF